MNVLKISGLTKPYRLSVLQMLDKNFERAGIFNIDISLDKGEAYGLLGAEGSGKTTLIRSTLGLVRAVSGNVLFFGKKKVRALNTALRYTGYMPEEYTFYEDSNGWQFLRLMASGRKVDRTFRDHLLEVLGLGRDKLKEKVVWYTPVQQQKLVMVSAMQHKPPFLALDEPTRHMSMPERQAVYGLLDDFTAGGGAVLLSSTSAWEVETICHRIGILHKGRIIAEETPESFRKKALHNFALHLEPPPNPEFFQGLGSEGPKKGGSSLHFQAAGDMDWLLKQLQAAGRIKSLDLERAPVEDLIRKFYTEEDNHA